MELKGEFGCKIFYGTNEAKMDITFDVLLNCCDKTTVVIPATNQAQDKLFSDPLVGIVKNVWIQDNGKLMVFDSSQPVVYTFQSTNAFFMHAASLRKEHLAPLDFAMQLMMCAFADGPVLKIGGKFGIPTTLVHNCIPIVIVEHDLQQCMNPKFTTCSVIPSAFAFAPVILTKSKIVAFETVVPMTRTNPVMLHVDNEYVDIKKNHKDLIFDNDGMSRVNLEDVESRCSLQFNTLVFDSDVSLTLALKQGAPRLLRHATKIIVCGNLERHDNMQYIGHTMNVFDMYLQTTYSYRTKHVFQFWQKKAK